MRKLNSNKSLRQHRHEQLGKFFSGRDDSGRNKNDRENKMVIEACFSIKK